MGFVPFTFVDFIDIILVAVIMYWIYRMRPQDSGYLFDKFIEMMGGQK